MSVQVRVLPADRFPPFSEERFNNTVAPLASTHLSDRRREIHARIYRYPEVPKCPDDTPVDEFRPPTRRATTATRVNSISTNRKPLRILCS